MNINIFSVLLIPYILWVGFTGRVDWWTIILVMLASVEVLVEIKSRFIDRIKRRKIAKNYIKERKFR